VRNVSYAHLLNQTLNTLHGTISQESKLIMENNRIQQNNLNSRIHNDQIYAKLKELEPLLALKDTLIREGLLKES
jgi:hypothetical protein